MGDYEIDTPFRRTKPGKLRIKWARSATKHRISKERSRHVIEHAELRFRVEPPTSASTRQPRLLYVGDDAKGVALEVIAVELDNDTLLVIHAMPVRHRFANQYERVMRQRRGIRWRR